MKKNKLMIIVMSLTLILSLVIFKTFISPYFHQEQTVKKNKTNEFETLSYYKKNNLSRYKNYKKNHQKTSQEEVVTLVNMQRDYDFYQKIIRQNHPDDVNTLVNKYYQLDSAYEPADLVKINDTNNNYGAKYSKHTARSIVYNDFQALKKACQKQGFELYVCSGYRSTSWQDEIYHHMVETYDQETADKTCSRPGHSEHTTGLGLDIALDNYQFEDIRKHPHYSWFLKQLSDYGFIIRYPENKENLTGYEYEPWHIRYLCKELAKKLEKIGLTYDEFYARNF